MEQETHAELLRRAATRPETLTAADRERLADDIEIVKAVIEWRLRSTDRELAAREAGSYYAEPDAPWNTVGWGEKVRRRG